MAQTYTPDLFWELYEKLRPELKEAVFAEKTAMNIVETCLKNNAPENKISEVARRVGRVFLGILPQEDFQKELEEEVKIPKKTAEKIAQEIGSLIFNPLKAALQAPYDKSAAPAKSGITEDLPESVQESVAELIPEETPQKTPQTQRGDDSYRESIE